MVTIPSTTYKSRLLIIGSAILILVWSGLEDSQMGGVVFLGWVMSLFSVSYFTMRHYGGRVVQSSTLVKLSPLVGASMGAIASILTALLMLFKDVRHAHVFPDYPPQMILDILSRLPIWSMSAGLIVLGVTIVFYVVRRPSETD